MCKMSSYHTLLCVYVAFNVAVRLGQTAPVTTRKPALNAEAFLQNYGYLRKGHPDVANMVHQSHVNGAIRRYQEFMKLPVTGVLDEATRRLMESPRCGVPDIMDERDTRFKRHDLSGHSWPDDARHLTWSVSQMTHQMSRYEVEHEVREALKLWSEQTDFTFIKDDSGGNGLHIDIKFVRGDHGDGYPFEGQGSYDNVLAHAFLPQDSSGRRGQVHFDDADPWKISYGDNHFRFIATHEFGHTLGLRHSSEPNSVMYANYPGYKAEYEYLQLHQDDIDHIRAVYGTPRQESVTFGYPDPPIADDDEETVPFVPSGSFDDDDDGDLFRYESGGSVFINWGLDDDDLFNMKTNNSRRTGRPVSKSIARSPSGRSFLNAAVAFIVVLALFIG